MFSCTEIEHLVGEDIAAYAMKLRNGLTDQNQDLQQATVDFLACVEDQSTIQAQLVIAGYELCGGKDTTMIVQAARAVQLIHASLEPSLRPSAAQLGRHAAMIVLANVPATVENRIKALSITNRALLLHAQAQISTEPLPDALATEYALNPVHVGMVLAGADCDATDAITPYMLAAGRKMVDATYDQNAAAKALSAITYWPKDHLKTLVAIIERFPEV